MKSHTTKRFQEAFKALPKHIQRQAREAYKLFQQNPYHPSLYFKQVHHTKPIYSVRISRDYRAVGVRDGDEIIWYWIGSHADYNGLLSKM
ncbi:MAG: ParE family toxin-like protein [Anaerolineae bacterium]